MIAPKKEDIAKWYEQVIFQAGIASPGLVKGTFFIHPRGWNIWEKIQSFTDKEFKKVGIKNVAFPSLIPLVEIEKEKEKLTGFKPELYLISRSTDDSNKPTSFLRPTSEILFSHFFRKTLISHEQLPFLFNQWCNVYRAEKNTKSFLRTCEFYWQEAHTLHKTKEDAFEYLHVFHGIYQRLLREVLNIAVLVGEKTVNERFQGADNTLTLEAIMPDGQALQVATSHYLAKNFSEMFEIKYSSEENKLENPYQLSAGSSTRLIGALILSHSDDNGLVLPFGVADVQIKVLSIGGVVEKDDVLYLKISEQLREYAYEWDFSDKSFGFKMKNEELIGTPFVVVVGSKEIESGKLMIKSRLSTDKEFISIDCLKDYFEKASVEYSKKLYESSQKNLQDSIVEVKTLEEANREVLENKKIVLVPWFDDEANEVAFKNEKLGYGPRCIKEAIVNEKINCFYSGKQATVYAYFGRSY